MSSIIGPSVKSATSIDAVTRSIMAVSQGAQVAITKFKTQTKSSTKVPLMQGRFKTFHLVLKTLKSSKRLTLFRGQRRWETWQPSKT